MRAGSTLRTSEADGMIGAARDPTAASRPPRSTRQARRRCGQSRHTPRSAAGRRDTQRSATQSPRPRPYTPNEHHPPTLRALVRGRNPPPPRSALQVSGPPPPDRAPPSPKSGGRAAGSLTSGVIRHGGVKSLGSPTSTATSTISTPFTATMRRSSSPSKTSKTSPWPMSPSGTSPPTAAGWSARGSPTIWCVGPPTSDMLSTPDISLSPAPCTARCSPSPAGSSTAPDTPPCAPQPDGPGPPPSPLPSTPSAPCHPPQLTTTRQASPHRADSPPNPRPTPRSPPQRHRQHLRRWIQAQ